MTPSSYYQQKSLENHLTTDTEQTKVLSYLDRLHEELLAEHQRRQSIWRHFQKPRPPRGLYLYGSVGIGKTFLMDCLYHTLPFPEKMRLHFHAFMQHIHLELAKLAQQKNPLSLIAKNIAAQTSVLCFDEIHVTEIVDAMLLAILFKELIHHGVCLVATSNTAPDRLYERGLQRDRFLPAIELLKAHTEVLHLHTNTDYRLRYLQSAGVSYIPNDSQADQQLALAFEKLASDMLVSHEPITLFGRTIHIRKEAGNIIWLDFNALCKPPRNQHDYLALAKHYRTIMISNIPVIRPKQRNTIALFIRLIDVLYDAHTRLIFSAEVPVDAIYTEGEKLAEFARTRSRLHEMQSAAWLNG